MPSAVSSEGSARSTSSVLRFAILLWAPLLLDGLTEPFPISHVTLAPILMRSFGIATAIGFPPSQSSVLTQQPDTLPGFLLDIFFGVWIGAAIGEEVFFRGFLLAKFSSIFGDGRIGLALAVLAQAVWFGSGHVSQGISGMIMAGTIGAVLGLFFLIRARRALLPLIIGHGLVDTLSLTINFLS